MVEPPLDPTTAAPTIALFVPPPKPSLTTFITSTCPPLMPEMVPVLVEALEQIMVDKSALVVVPTLAELCGEDEL